MRKKGMLMMNSEYTAEYTITRTCQTTLPEDGSSPCILTVTGKYYQNKIILGVITL